MGSGKSTWAINYINQHPDERFLCIVPLLSECDRFKNDTEIEIVDPEKWGNPTLRPQLHRVYRKPRFP